MNGTIPRRNSIINGLRRKGLTVLEDAEVDQCGRMDAQSTTGLIDHMKQSVLLC